MNTPSLLSRLARMLADPCHTQAGAWLEGMFRVDAACSIRVPLAPAGRQDSLSDVPIPNWPHGHDSQATREALDAFVDAGLLERVADGAYRRHPEAGDLFKVFPLFHHRNAESLPRRFTQLADAVTGKRVLDAGCGLAAYTLTLAGLGPTRIVGLDYSDSQLAIATRIAPQLGGSQIRFMRGSVEGLPLADRCVDFIFCRVVLPLVHHRRTMSEFARVLAPGGRALLMMHGPRYYLNMLARVGPSSARLREFVYGACGLLGGAIFDVTGREPTWRLRSRPFQLIYERRPAFERLIRPMGLDVESWETGTAKPYAWLRKVS